MKIKDNLKRYWRMLDDQAKIYSLSYNKKDTSVFRLSVTLTENIKEDILNKAFLLALNSFKSFSVKLQRGFFWYYMEYNSKYPIVSIEDDYPFRRLINKKNNDYLFKVTYFNNKINVDYFHVLTDGNGGALFLKEIVCRYIELLYPKKFKYEATNIVIDDVSNDYKKNYLKSKKRGYKYPVAYTIKGEALKYGKVSLNHFVINLNDIKLKYKNSNCTLSIFLVSMLAYSLYETNYKKHNGKKPINICVPINLKNYFASKTNSNFVSFMMVSLSFKSNKKYKFDDIIMMVKKEFDKKLKYDKIISNMTSDGKLINNVFVRLVPLLLKKCMVLIGTLSFKKHFTMTFSNLGIIDMDSKYSKYVKDCFFIMSPDWAEKLRCGVCSYGDNLVVSFGSNIKSNEIEVKFKDLLDEFKIKYSIEGNGINVISN